MYFVFFLLIRLGLCKVRGKRDTKQFCYDFKFYILQKKVKIKASNYVESLSPKSNYILKLLFYQLKI
ncbi:MAG: hypothetical protein DI622_05165 [Chryseobacterium sp.]|nr:MAG: hypothetical protein DI622_05165 [Chryseobacterium sp.]